MASRVQILEVAVCILQCKYPWERYVSHYSLVSYELAVVQTRLFNLGIVTGLEGKL